MFDMQHCVVVNVVMDHPKAETHSTWSVEAADAQTKYEVITINSIRIFYLDGWIVQIQSNSIRIHSKRLLF